ncbi:MAG: dihydroneopterin aldolase [Cyanobacteria bacterium SBLK]|nr:dihydroneopterin aldolase [Cyanobacteria bacterium SBLK]
MDEIKITGIRAYGYTGALPEENVLGQWFEVDLILWLDITKAAQSDALEDTFDYRETINLVKHIIQTEKFSLIEKLATVMVEKILTFEKIQKVQMNLTKLAAPIPDFSGRVSVSLTREKNAIA